MDGASLTRMRWRLRGASMWPAFVVLTVADGLIVHWLPYSGDSQSPVWGWLVGVFLSLLGIVVVAPGLGILLRRVRTDMPQVVARDYAGTGLIAVITALLLTAGLVHHHTVASDASAGQDATARAQAYIGDRAPNEFRRNLNDINTIAIQPPEIYRTCVTSANGAQSYCVVVNRALPFSTSVRYSGSEPNSVLAQGTQ